MGACMTTTADGHACHEEWIQRTKLKRKFPSSPLTEHACVDGRLCANGISKSCCAYSKQGQKGVSQDRFIAWEGLGAERQAVLCGVFDGHGPMGHLVAHKVRNSLSRFLSSEENISLLVSTKWQACTERGHLDSTTTESSDDLVPLRNVFVDCYERMDNELRTQAQTDCEFSGTTAVTLLIQGRNLVIANVGDSRAILASRKADGLSLHVEQLTVDFKPDLPGELERIKNCKGRVFALEDEPEVARLWLPHENRPGLAMARALGDFCLKEYGLSAIPHVCFRRIDEDDEFVVLATDGVWDVMSNEEVANVVKNTESKGMAAKKVVDAAVKKWKRNFTHVRMDDCAVVCHFLNQKHSISVCYSDMSQSSSRLMNSELLHQESTTNTVAPCLDRGI